ncbi:MAG: hypothetical protein AB3N34_01190 [Lettuce witches'-broom phytoplasma]
MQKIRGDKIAMIFQDPVAGLNPVLKIKKQIMEVLIVHRQMSTPDLLQISSEHWVRCTINNK